MKGLKGKCVLVTGASSGIGQAIAIRFAQEGANVAINYYSDQEEALETKHNIDSTCQAIEGCGVESLVVQADVSKQEDVDRMFEITIDQLGGIDILINNAGMQLQGPSHEIDVDKVDRIIAINLLGSYLCARKTIQHCLSQQKPGLVLNTSSVHEIIPRPEYIGYSISKGGMENMTRTLALEYAKHGIRVNAIGPGATATPINDWANDPEAKAKLEKHIPMRRVGTPEEMAAVAAFMASDEASYITGQTLFIDGGLTLYPSFQEQWT